ncbi:MAG: PD-(D/E)XK nuclease family protein [Clostridia bacterium]|nr:PD-(D/E)XK nuclease family protein [Clostridia bacterium]
MLTFLYGRSGSGKTARIIEDIKESVSLGKQTYLLVPEQQAFISESMLADLPPASALSFEVVSFSRLCEIVFAQYGGLTDAPAGSGARALMMWQCLREVSSLLQEYKGVKADAAFGSMMLSAIDELRVSGISAEDCERASAECDDPILSRKLYDVSLIYANYERILSSRLGEAAVAAENKLQLLIALLEKHHPFEGCRIFVDSFTSFTGEEHRILELLALQAEELCITFCAASGAHTAPHTESISNTVRRFRAFAAREGLETREIRLAANKRTENEALLSLERGLWDFSVTEATRPKVSDSALSAIDTAVCKNEFEEAHYAALQILKAHGEGVKFSEMALIMRDTESRKGIIDAVFEKFGIPYFYSEKTDLSATPVARLIFSALRCITYNFRTSDVLTLLKTGLCGIDPVEADLFEDYCHTWEISGNTFSAELWSMHPDGYTTDPLTDRTRQILGAANRVRAQLIPPLLSLRRKLSLAEGNTKEGCRAIYEYLSEISLAERLSDLAELELTSGNLREAGEILRIYDYLISALTDISTTLCDVNTTCEELSYAIEIMLRNTDIGSVPAVGDYVTVGNAATLRVENVRVAILLGLCEGEFPAAYSDTGIFTENDKALMEDYRLTLSSRESRVTSDELFYVYRAMTKPSERLILCTCTSRVGGGALSRSSAWNRVLFLFPNLKEKAFDLALVKRLAAEMQNSDRANDEGDYVCSAEAEELTEIDPMQVRMLFGDRLYLSKSTISTFAECPYKYWCRYVLELREQKVSSISYNNAGTMIHYILEKYISETKTEDGRLNQLSDAETVDLVNRLTDRYVREIGCPLPPSTMYSFSRLRDLALIMVKSVTDEFMGSQFRILAQEQAISDRRVGALRPIEIKVNEEQSSPVVVLGGVIDRIDCYDGEDGKYLRIVDYKTGSHAYDVSKVADGQDLQLPAYLFTAALEENRALYNTDRRLVPASALFLSANEEGGEIKPERSGFILRDMEILQAASAEMDKSMLAGIYLNKDGEIKGKAAVSEEEISQIRETLKSSVASTARSIYAGHAPRTPSETACKFCFLKGNCPVACKK